MGAGTGDDQRLRPDRNHSVCVQECAADSRIGSAAHRRAGAGGGVVRRSTGGYARCRLVWSASCMSPAAVWALDIGARPH